MDMSTRTTGGETENAVADAGYQMAIDGVASPVRLAGGETLLKGGLRSGVKMPHLCLVGECGSCKCRLLKGKVRLKRDISAHVGASALRQGYLLTCQSEALSDVVLAVPGISPTGDSGVQLGISGRIKSALPLNHDIRHLVITLDKPISYVAGQYAQLSVPFHPQLDEEARCYSFCSAPQAEPQTEVSFHVRHVPGGAFTDWLFAADRSGDEIRLSGAFGDMHYHDSGRPVVCIAGGSGLAPIKALLESLSTRAQTPDLTLFFAARSQRDLYCLNELAALQAQWKGSGRMLVVPVLSNEPADSGWDGLTGYCGDHLREFCSLADSDFYLCGPPVMIDSVLDKLRGTVAAAQIHYDRFLDRSTIAPTIKD